MTFSDAIFKSLSIKTKWYHLRIIEAIWHGDKEKEIYYTAQRDALADLMTTARELLKNEVIEPTLN